MTKSVNCSAAWEGWEPLREGCADKLGQILNICLGMCLLEIIILPRTCIPIYQDERENYPSLSPDVHRVSHSDWARDAVLVAAVLSHLSCFVSGDHRDRE